MRGVAIHGLLTKRWAWTDLVSFPGAVLAFLILVASVACGSDDEADPAFALQKKSFAFTEEEWKAIAIEEIGYWDHVRDADVELDGRTFYLYIVVEYATSVEWAKEVGEAFVRLVKTFGPDADPGLEVGKGEYDYLVDVSYPNGKGVALGAKIDFARRITW